MTPLLNRSPRDVNSTFPKAGILEIVLASLLFTAPALLHAQGGASASSCDIAEALRGSAIPAAAGVKSARESASPAAAASHLRNAVKAIESTKSGDDPIANAYVLGTAISSWASQPGIGLTPTRRTLGFSANPDGVLDVPGALDSLFKLVEATKPACADYTAFWRAGQRFYLDVVNSAMTALASEKLDSAEYYATQANRLYAPSPYGNMVLGGVAAKRGDNPKAVQYWTAAASLAEKDTSYRDVQRQVLANISKLALSSPKPAETGQASNAAPTPGNACSGIENMGLYKNEIFDRAMGGGVVEWLVKIRNNTSVTKIVSVGWRDSNGQQKRTQVQLRGGDIASPRLDLTPARLVAPVADIRVLSCQ
jgi:hypothetical protein